MEHELNFKRADLPSGFQFGVATSSYQIEGSSFGGCGASHWDSFAATPGNTTRAENGAIACDHYHRYKEDVSLIAGAGFDHYRFSASWARVMPDGKAINPEGLDFYDRLTDALLEKNIKPMLTLHHWEMPSPMADIGGWRNPEITDRFATFTDVLTRRIGDRMWASGTFNEPWCITWLSHFYGIHAPGLRDIRATARTMHHMLVAHGKAIEVMRSAGMSNLGIYLNFEPSEPADDTEAAKLATARHHAQYNECFLEPLFKGRYAPLVMEGLEPHLPDNWQDDMGFITQKLDWLGINNYTRKLIAEDAEMPWPSFKEIEGPLPKTAMGWEISPESFERLLRWIAKDYTGDLPLYVTENGMAGPEQADGGICHDPERIDYLNSHVDAMRRVMADGVPIKGYTVWSLLDNYEWSLGYDKRFGLIHVDYKTLKRTPKTSWYAFCKALAA